MSIPIYHTITQDVVGVFDGFDQVFRDARPMRADIKEESRTMDHPVESGAMVTDHIVFQSVEIELSMTLKASTYRDTYNEIRQLFREGKILTVQTRSARYENQIITSIPHEETPDVFDTIQLAVKTKEIMMVTPEFEVEHRPLNPAQGKTEERGETQPEKRRGSWASRNIRWR